jgi:Rod binding domain-containing protein
MGNFRIPLSGTNNTSATLATNDSALQALRNKSGKDTLSKIDKAAHDFESILVGQWLEKAEKSFATVPGTDPDQSRDSAHDQFQSIACEALAKGLSKTGGFGMASMISKHLVAIEVNQASGSALKAPSGGQPTSSLSPSNLNIYRQLQGNSIPMPAPKVFRLDGR